MHWLYSCLHTNHDNCETEYEGDGENEVETNEDKKNEALGGLLQMMMRRMRFLTKRGV